MQCHGQLSHDVTKKVIKAALKLCVHVIYFRDVQRVVKNVKKGQYEGKKIGHITILYFCKKSLIVIKPTFI